MMNSDRTKYPSIFKSTYWDEPYDPKKSNLSKEIFKNRNRFVEEFNVKKYIESPQSIYSLSLFDHCELYQCESNYVYITSPYSKEESLIELIEKYNFKKYMPMYFQGCNTYIRVFNSKKEFDSFIKLVEQDIRSHNY